MTRSLCFHGSYGQSDRFTPEIDRDHETLQCFNKVASNQSVDARDECRDDESEIVVMRSNDGS
jgi:hypothetical protein